MTVSSRRPFASAAGFTVATDSLRIAGRSTGSTLRRSRPATIGPNDPQGAFLFCREAGSFSQLRQYQLERKSMSIHLARDRKTATVTAEYVETMPYYEPDRRPATLDDFMEFQVVEILDESVVGIEDGDLVFLSTRSEAHQALVPKTSLDIPYD